jgi:phenylacetic acid degradation protein paaN
MPEITTFIERHRERLDEAVAATAARSYWSAYPESPSPRVYGENANDDGKAAFEALLGKDFRLTTPGASGLVGDERSPFGLSLRIRYPHVTTDGVTELLAAGQAALPAWRDAGAQARATVCIEILDRLNKRSFEMAYAVMHTTGQAFMMAFQAGGPHAQDRGLEAVAYAYAAQNRVPATAEWEKPQGKHDPLRMEKTFHIVPRGIALMVGCNTFPTWNGYPGLFASLATGNPVIVKPHPNAVLPLAITVAVAQEVLTEAGFSPDLVTLAAEAPGEGIASVFAQHPAVRIIDFTGSSAYGNWLEEHAKHAAVYTEKAGVNTIIIDSTDDFTGMVRNIAFSLSLYSGQMCTAPQNIFIPRDGILVSGEKKTFDEVAEGIAAAVNGLLGDDARAVEILGGIVNDGVRERIEQAPALGDVVLPSRSVAHPAFPGADVRTPVMVRLDSTDEGKYSTEHFGPISFVIATDSTADSIDIFRRTVGEHGALTASVYSTDSSVLEATLDAAMEAGVALSCNLTGAVYVNQSAAFSDYHGTGANPAANACLTDDAFVTNRFRVVQSRRHL